MEEWSNGVMEEWKNGGMEEWKNGGMEEWRNGRMEEWKNGVMEDWKNVAPIHLEGARGRNGEKTPNIEHRTSNNEEDTGCMCIGVMCT